MLLGKGRGFLLGTHSASSPQPSSAQQNQPSGRDVPMTHGKQETHLSACAAANHSWPITKAKKKMGQTTVELPRIAFSARAHTHTHVIELLY